MSEGSAAVGYIVHHHSPQPSPLGDGEKKGVRGGRRRRYTPTPSRPRPPGRRISGNPCLAPVLPYPLWSPARLPPSAEPIYSLLIRDYYVDAREPAMDAAVPADETPAVLDDAMRQSLLDWANLLAFLLLRKCVQDSWLRPDALLLLLEEDHEPCLQSLFNFQIRTMLQSRITFYPNQLINSFIDAAEEVICQRQFEADQVAALVGVATEWRI